MGVAVMVVTQHFNNSALFGSLLDVVSAIVVLFFMKYENFHDSSGVFLKVVIPSPSGFTLQQVHCGCRETFYSQVGQSVLVLAAGAGLLLLQDKGLLVVRG